MIDDNRPCQSGAASEGAAQPLSSQAAAGSTWVVDRRTPNAGPGWASSSRVCSSAACCSPPPFPLFTTNGLQFTEALPPLTGS